MEKIKTTKPHSREERKAIIELWQESGKNKTDFCKEFGIKYQTFIGWTCPKKKKIKQGLTESSSSFIPVRVKSNADRIFAELTLQNGSSIIFHQSVGVDLLKSLLR